MWEIHSLHFKRRPCWLLSLQYKQLQLSNIIAASFREVSGTASSLPIAGSTTRLPGIKVNDWGNWSLTGTSWWVFLSIQLSISWQYRTNKVYNSGSFSGLHALSFTLIWNGVSLISLQWKWYLMIIITVILLRRCSNNAVVKHTRYSFVTLIVRVLNWFYTKYQTISYTVIGVHQQDCFMTRQIVCMITGSFPFDPRNKHNLVGNLTWMIYVLFILYFQVWSIKQRKGGLQSALKPGLPHTITYWWETPKK